MRPAYQRNKIVRMLRDDEISDKQNFELGDLFRELKEIGINPHILPDFIDR